MPGFLETMLDKAGGRDYLMKQRAMALLLSDIIAFFAAVFIFLDVATSPVYYSARTLDIVGSLTVMFGALISVGFLIKGYYKAGAHLIVALITLAIWSSNLFQAGNITIKSETFYLVALSIISALLLGRIWIIIYGTGSLIVVSYITMQLMVTSDQARTFFLDACISIATVTSIAVLISATYDKVLGQVKWLLGEQQVANQSLRNLNLKLEQIEAQRRQFYRETIYSVTGGKLRISDEAEIKPYVECCDESLQVIDIQDITNARNCIKNYCFSHGLIGDSLDMFVAAVGEALTNAYKHAGGGVVFVGSDERRVWVITIDHGPGIESLALPRSVLLRGYSTKASLGLGYSIILDASDEVILKTDETGTALVLIINFKAESQEITLGNLPDTW